MKYVYFRPRLCPLGIVFLASSLRIFHFSPAWNHIQNSEKVMFLDSGPFLVPAAQVCSIHHLFFTYKESESRVSKTIPTSPLLKLHIHLKASMELQVDVLMPTKESSLWARCAGVLVCWCFSLVPGARGQCLSGLVVHYNH